MALLVPPSTARTGVDDVGWIRVAMRIRGLDPVSIDPGVFFWDDVAEGVADPPGAGGVVELRGWLEGCLCGDMQTCVVAVPGCAISPAICAAGVVSQVVQNVLVAGWETDSLAGLADHAQLAGATFAGLLLPGGHLPLNRRIPIGLGASPHAGGTAEYLVLGPIGRLPSWEELVRATPCFREAGSAVSIPCPVAAPDDDRVLRDFFSSGVRELRFSVRTCSTYSRRLLGLEPLDDGFVDLLSAARRIGMRSSISLEVGFPWETRDIFQDSLARLRSLSHLIDSICDLQAHVPEGCEDPAWNDGGANCLSFRRSRARELGCMARALHIELPSTLGFAADRVNPEVMWMASERLLSTT